MGDALLESGGGKASRSAAYLILFAVIEAWNASIHRQPCRRHLRYMGDLHLHYSLDVLGLEQFGDT